MLKSNLTKEKNNVMVQVQKKRRKNHSSGIWGSQVPEGLLSMLGDACSNLWANRSQWGNNLEGAEWVKEQIKRQQFSIVQQEDEDICFSSPEEMEDDQIVFMERSPAHDKLEEVLREGKQFNDTRFPPNHASLHGVQTNKDWVTFEWNKLSKVCPNAQIFQGKPVPTDIKQGYIGDCYFMAALAALAQRPDRIFNLFLTKQVNKAKYFSVKILFKGKWMVIDMDQFVPCNGSQLAFSSSIRKDLWVIILEKAWAKLYKSYNRIVGGLPRQVLHDLTGAPMIEYNWKNEQSCQKDKIWKDLLIGSEKEYAMVAGSVPGQDHYHLTTVGIAKSHAYTLLNAFTLKVNGKEVKLIQLRNPWGISNYGKDTGEYNGPWCDNDPNWNYVSENDKRQIGYKKNSNDGLFFIDYDTFLENFDVIDIAQINDNASYVYKTLTDKQRKGVFFQVQIKKKGGYCFQINKIPLRSLFTNDKWSQYQYGTTTLKIDHIDRSQPIVYIKNRNINQQYEFTLQPGTYIVQLNQEFTSQNGDDFSVNLAVYSEYACSIEAATCEQVRKVTGNLKAEWNPVDHEYKGEWNELANDSYQQGDSGWGNHKPNKKEDKKQIQTPSNNNGWGDSRGKDQKQDNDGWGDIKKPQNNSDGWGNNNGWSTENNGWSKPEKANDSGWGEENSRWGKSDQSNGGWGDNQNVTVSIQIRKQNNTNDGWGDSGAFKDKTNHDSNQNSKKKKNQNDGWGQCDNTNNGWGQQEQNTNNGWGSGW